MRARRSVTATPTGIPSRTLNEATDFFARRTLAGGLEHLGVLLGLADPHVEGDLLQRGHGQRGRVAEAPNQLGLHFLLVALAQPWRRRCLLLLFGRGFH
jgi:hypothetical protein